jgi:hypothetical protein
MLTLRGIGIAVLVLLMAAVAADAQQPGRHARVGYLVGGAPAFDPRRHDHGALVTGLRSEDREGPRPHDPAVGTGAHDPADRVTRAGTLRMSPECRSDLATTLTPRADQK